MAKIEDLVIKPQEVTLATNEEFPDDPPLAVTPTLINYNDHGNILMSATALSNHITPGVYANAIKDYTIKMSVDTLTFGAKNNVIYADIQNLSLIATGNVVSNNIVTQAYVVRNTFNYGDDVITAGNGKNTVYGDSQDILLKAEKGINLDGSAAPSNTFAPDQLGPTEMVDSNQFDFGEDTITLGSGNNTVFGDARDVSMIALCGTLMNDPTGLGSFLQNSVVALNEFNFAHDEITVGDGNNTIYGDFKNWLMQADGGTTFGTYVLGFTFGGVYDNTIMMVGDTVNLGDGNNTVFGDGQNLLMTEKSGIGLGGLGPFGALHGNFITFGDDIIQPDVGKTASGHNLVYGDLQNISLEATSQLQLGPGVEGGGYIVFSVITLGSDMITLGNGGNVIYGDTNDVTYTVLGGNNSNPDLLEGFTAISGNELTFGDDPITSGSGADTIYADAHNISLTAQGEQATISSSFAEIGIVEGVPNSFDFGQDTVHAGGGIDLIVGDAWDVSLISKGGLATSPDLISLGSVDGVQMSADEDHLFGEGGNDTIYGDFHSLTLQAIGGDVHGTGGTATGEVTNNIITFGDDKIDGGAGNDTLYGDLQNLTLLALNGKDTSGVGDVHGILSGNVLDWGDDTLTGGTGADQFAFLIQDESGLVTQGSDTITDFSLSQGDKMVMKVGADVDYAALNAAAPATLINADGGVIPNDTKFTFHDGSSITLLNIDLTAGFNAANTVLAH